MRIPGVKILIKYLENNFKEEVEGKKILVDFYADWCGPCQMMSEVLEEIREIDVLKINVDKYPQIAKDFGVMSIPTIILMDHGKNIKKNVGFLDINGLKEFIK